MDTARLLTIPSYLYTCPLISVARLSTTDVRGTVGFWSRRSHVVFYTRLRIDQMAIPLSKSEPGHEPGAARLRSNTRVRQDQAGLTRIAAHSRCR